MPFVSSGDPAGAVGDLVISSVNPLDDLPGFADHERSIAQVIQGGSVVVDRSTA